MHRVNAQMKQNANAMLCSMPKSMQNRLVVDVVVVAARVKSKKVEMLQEPAWRAREDVVSNGQQRRLVQMRRLTIYC
jgi:hypothetical protein